MKTVVGLVSVWALVTFASCGGASGLGTCGNSPPCGGNVVGSWSISSVCATVQPAMADASCPTATFSITNVSLTGTIVYNADLTYSADTTTLATENIALPTSCIVQQGVTLTCDQVSQQLSAAQGITSARCSTIATGCSCAVGVTVAAAVEGTYTTSASGLLTLMNTNGTNQADFCVTGNSMTLSPRAGTGFMGTNLVSMETINLARH
jgi:hypothetical protein